MGAFSSTYINVKEWVFKADIKLCLVKHVQKANALFT